MLNTGLGDSQAEIKIPGRNNNFRYADDIPLMAESKEELKNFLMKVKEGSEIAGLKLNIQKTNMMASSPVPSWQIDGGKMGTVTNFIFLGSKITTDGACSHEIKRHLPFGRKTVKILSSVSVQFQFISVAQSCLTLCDPINCSTPGLPVHHQLPEFTQIHVHQVSDAIQPSHPLSSPSPPAPNPFQHQSLFQ